MSRGCVDVSDEYFVFSNDLDQIRNRAPRLCSPGALRLWRQGRSKDLVGFSLAVDHDRSAANGVIGITFVDECEYLNYFVSTFHTMLVPAGLDSTRSRVTAVAQLPSRGQLSS